MNIKKPPKGMSVLEFVDAHEKHFVEASLTPVLQEIAPDDADDHRWQLICPCGLKWLGDNREFGIEVKKNAK